MKNIILLGASGYIGNNLIKYLYKKNLNIKGISKKKFNCSKIIHINDYKTFKIFNILKNFDTIIYCAGHINNNLNAFSSDINQRILKYLSKFCEEKKKKIHFIYLSSVGVYGFSNSSQDKTFINEQTKLKASNKYEILKKKTERLLQINSNNFFSYTILRVGSVVSKNMKSNFFKMIIFFIKSPFFFYIKTDQTLLNLIHIDDLNKGIYCVVNSKKSLNQIYNLSNNYKLKSFVYLIKKNTSFFFNPIILSEPIANFFLFPFKLIFNLKNTNVLTTKKYISSKKITKNLNFNFKYSAKKILEDFI